MGDSMDKQGSQPDTQKEKPSTHNAKAQKIMLIFGGVVVIALVISMFVSPGTHTPKPSNNNGQQRPNTQYASANGFADQVNFDQDRETFKNSHQARIALIRKRQQSYREKAPSNWQKKEMDRVIASRTVGFGFELKSSIQNSVNRSPHSENLKALPSSGALTTQVRQLETLLQKKQPHLSDAVGSTIIGHAINDHYSGQMRKGELPIPTGTVMSGALDQDVNSDYAGPWRGILTQDVYSINNEFILLPKGTQLIGQAIHIANVNEPIQNRMGLTVEWAVLPNGQRINFHEQSIEDRSGIAAMSGDVNRHLWWQFGGVAAYALLSASMPRDNTNAYGSVNPTFSGQLADGVRQQLTPMVSKYLSLVLTVHLQAGTPIKVFIQTDVYTKPWSRVNQTVY
jgi:type IV secretory pathway VirB10-like protein